MTARRAARQAARRPEPRTVTVRLNSEYTGWEVTARADFPARVLADLQSDSIERIFGALDRIVVDHNFPDADGKLATSFADVDPYDGVLRASEGIFDAIGALPKR